MRRTIVLFAALGLILAGCSSGGGDNSDPDTGKTDVAPDTGGQVEDVVDDPDVGGTDEPDVQDVVDVLDVPPDVPEDEDIYVPPECETEAQCEHLLPEGNLCYEAKCVDGECEVGEKKCAPEDHDPCDLWYCDPGDGECKVTLHEDCVECTTDTDCFDGNPCTEDKCVPDPENGQNSCDNPLLSAACDDGNPCTTGDICQASSVPGAAPVCAGSTPVTCDDGDNCTADWCDPASTEGCQHTVIGTPPCDEEITCTPGDASTCPNLVAQGNVCQEFFCNDNSVCELRERVANCDDGNPCTSEDYCSGGVCVGGPATVCDDSDPCTNDWCDPAGAGCMFEPQEPCRVPCSRDDECTNFGGADGVCTVGTCTEVGFCAAVQLVGDSCDDGDPCTTGDRCEEGQCVAGPPLECDEDCPAGSVSICDPVEGCICDDSGSVCPTNPGCESGTDCDDGDPCTIDSCLTYREPSICQCTPVEACSCDPTDPDADAMCDDGDRCTADRCVPNDDPSIPHAGLCEHDFSAINCCEVACTGPEDMGACDDSDKCTLDTCELLDEEADAYCCEHPQIPYPCGAPCTTDDDCSDSNPCTQDTCGADGTCDPPGPAVLCDCSTDDDCEDTDDDICTVAACVDRRCEMVDAPESTVCDDGDGCTIGDHCGSDGVGWTCIGGEPRDCDDGNDCTDDTCDPVSGCRHEFNTEHPGCELGCNEQDDPVAFCDDGDPCTVDSCNAMGECVNTDMNENEATPICVRVPCSDEQDCDDGNPCTVDVCRSQVQDPDSDTTLPLPLDERACEYTHQPSCVIEELAPALGCESQDDCDPANCVPDGERAWCENPGVDCPMTVCDPAAGCRFLPTAECPFSRECAPATQAVDCDDRNPCTQDICDPETLTCPCIVGDEDPDCTPEAAYRPPVELDADNLFGACHPCGPDSACEMPESYAGDPCVKLECRYREGLVIEDILEGETPGTCWIFVDQDLFPNACEDYDLCTIDTCVPDVGCAHDLRNDSCQPCVTNMDCDDFDPCTEDECADNQFQCTHTPIENCTACASNADCPYDNACEMQICYNGVCRSEALGGGPVTCVPLPCANAQDCDDDDPGTMEACAVGNDACLYLPVVPCQAVEECFTPQPCRMATACDAGTCVFEDVPGCIPQACTSAADCDDNDDCTNEFCSNGYCFSLPVPDASCCETVEDCSQEFADGVDACGVPVCTARGVCDIVAFHESARCGSACTTDEDCARSSEVFECPPESPDCTETIAWTSFCLNETECYDWPCAEAKCGAGGNCVWFDGDCTQCSDDGDCVDADPCTIDTCVAGSCDHAPAPNCTATPCSAEAPCVAPDPCTLGICIPSTGCIWIPNPTCAQ